MPRARTNAPDRTPRSILRRGAASGSVIVGSLIILGLLIAGLWLASRYAKGVLAESREQSSVMQRDLAASVRQGMQEAAEEESTAALDSLPTPVPVDDPVLTNREEIAHWTGLVNAFLAQEVLAGGTDGENRSMAETLDRASERLDQAEPYPPAVEGAIRTLLALSYQDQGRLDHAGAQVETALEVLRRVYGELHPYSVQARRNVGAVRLAQGRFDEAINIYQVLFETRLATLGPDDPLTEATMQTLRLLRGHEADLMATDPLEGLSNELKALLDDPPDCCGFAPLEF